MEARKFDQRHAEVFSKYYCSLNQVEEEMFMRKLYEVMSISGLTKKNEENSNATYNSVAQRSNAARKGRSEDMNLWS